MAAYDELTYQQGEPVPLLTEPPILDLDAVILEAQNLRGELALSTSVYMELCGAISMACWLAGWYGPNNDDSEARHAVARALRHVVGGAEAYRAGAIAQAGDDGGRGE